MSGKKQYKDFESALTRLEEIVGELESGELSLEKSIDLYTEGVEIAQICDKKLTEAEGKIARLTKIADKFHLEELEEADE